MTTNNRYRSRALRSDDAEEKDYVGFATLPNQVHRKSVKKGFDFTLMVAGESGLGKSTLVNSLFLTDLHKDRKLLNAEERISQTVEITKHTVDIEEKGVKLKLTIVDTPGFGDAVDNSECWRPVTDYIEQQFEQYFRDESGLNRKNIQDNRVHCCLYFIPPFGHGLRPVDVEFMRALQDKVNVVPLIAKADCLTPTEMKKLKERVKEDIDKYGIKIYQFPDCDSDEEEELKRQDRELKDSVPFAVIGSNTVVEARGQRVRGRLYPWGIVEDDCKLTVYESTCLEQKVQLFSNNSPFFHKLNKMNADQRVESPLPLLQISTPDAETEKLIKMKDDETGPGAASEQRREWSGTDGTRTESSSSPQNTLWKQFQAKAKPLLSPKLGSRDADSKKERCGLKPRKLNYATNTPGPARGSPVRRCPPPGCSPACPDKPTVAQLVQSHHKSSSLGSACLERLAEPPERSSGVKNGDEAATAAAAAAAEEEEAAGGAHLESRDEESVVGASSSSGVPPETPANSSGMYKLEVELKRGHNLAVRDRGGSSDPYVKFKLAGKEVFKSKTIHKNLNPVWDQKTTLIIDSLSEPLYVKVFDYDFGLQDDFMGSAYLHLESLEQQRTVPVTLVLKDPRHPDQDLGTLELAVTLTPKHSPIEERRDSMGEVKAYRWKPYVNRVSVAMTVAFSDFLLLHPQRPFPISPQMLFPSQ
ncbi:hypothetical protein fugu_019079 [Takifugu bimaculatus]|uniref:Uncharacterized protein n=1 Tax=Takifugu bimaculatus TaxID=433685 RepID=A0A4Z2BJX5_9TELE|nr:hypothetical protein fugu_019079 [Takifugu bimaculatus]